MEDYRPLPLSILIPADTGMDVAVCVDVEVLDDDVAEETEDFSVSLSAGNNPNLYISSSLYQFLSLKLKMTMV